MNGPNLISSGVENDHTEVELALLPSGSNKEAMGALVCGAPHNALTFFFCHRLKLGGARCFPLNFFCHRLKLGGARGRRKAQHFGILGTVDYA